MYQRGLLVGTGRVLLVAEGRRFGSDRRDGSRQETSILTDTYAVLETLCRGWARRTQNAAQKCTFHSTASINVVYMLCEVAGENWSHRLTYRPTHRTIAWQYPSTVNNGGGWGGNWQVVMPVYVCVCVYLQCPAFDDSDACHCCMEAIDNCLKTDDEGTLKRILYDVQ